VGRKKLVRKAEPPSKRRIAWPRWTGFRGKTVWDWLALLIVPMVLVGIGLLFEMQQADRQQAMEKQQRKLEEQRAEAEQDLAEQRAQDEALQAYLDQMSELILDRKLLEAEADSGAPEPLLAQARTRSVILRLDAEHNEIVTRFLSYSGLMGDETSVGLLSKAELSHTTLSHAFLPGADLHYAVLRKTNLSGANLAEANLSGTFMEKSNLSGADLFSAKLLVAHLEEANLSGADLWGADLSGAYLKGANLKEANLKDANVSEKQLLTAGSLEGATMPNGQKYVDWVKGKEGRETDRGNSSPS
jgi:uncharacterized protein YjbI with pentapeptide repeats